MRARVRNLVESQWFTSGITALIVINFFTIYMGTEGYDLEKVEIGILFIFATEASLKLYAYGPREWAKDGWNIFDAAIVTLGILPLLQVPLPEGFSGARALRLVRLLGRIPSTRVLIEAIFKSSKQLGGVGMLSGLFLCIFTLMATQAFQTAMPEWFGSFGVSFATLLSIAALSNLEIIGEAWKISPFGTLLVFPGFIVTVPLMALNLIIAVLSKAVDSVSPHENDSVSRTDFENLQEEIVKLRKVLEGKQE